MLDQWQPCFSVLILAPKCIYVCVIRTTEFIIRMKKCFDQNENNLQSKFVKRANVNSKFQLDVGSFTLNFIRKLKIPN